MARMSGFSEVIDKSLKPQNIRGFRGLPSLGQFGFRSEFGIRGSRPLVQFNPTMPKMPSMPKPYGGNRNPYRSPVDRRMMKF
jgi:hypothetical protein